MPFFTSFSGKILSVPGLKLGPKIFQFIKTFTSSVQEYNLRNDMIAAGWDGVLPATVAITINSGVYVWSNNTSIAAFTTGTMSSGTTISIVNNGYIIGQGGNGQTPTAQPQEGGPAINLNYPVSITNNSYIAGGGGGGGGAADGDGGGGGGAGGGAGGVRKQMDSGTVPTGGSAGSIGSSGGSGTMTKVGPIFSPQTGSRLYKRGSGGGGGRILPGTAGSAGLGADGTTDLSGGGGGAAGGGGGYYSEFSGLITTATGGAGGSAGNAGGNSSNSAAAGGGGGWGASGGSGAVSGANGGKCINLNGNIVSWIATGTRYGAIS